MSNSTKRQNFLLFDRLVADASKSTALLYNFLLGETNFFLLFDRLVAGASKSTALLYNFLLGKTTIYKKQ